MSYSRSLSDKEWELIEPLLPRNKKTRPRTQSKREILDVIFYDSQAVNPRVVRNRACCIIVRYTSQKR
ncbi:MULTISPECIES: transposase [unclassified Microcoleus]|uniref:transposase n=1 Tax=unclassified Microcoleus TaxID=2642155 RepID=UPI00403F1505